MSDLIDRQDLINALETDCSWEIFDDWGNRTPTGQAVIETIKKLPSAQPEIIRCRDCRHGVDYYHEGDCYCLNPKYGMMYFGGSWEFYCADAERRNAE